jgi:hypothetical protein
MHEPKLLVQIVKVEIEAFAWSVPQFDLMGLMILVGLQRSTKLDGGKDANEPFLHMVFLQDFLGGSLFGYFG